MVMRKVYRVRLSEQQRIQLQTMIGNGSVTAHKLIHARILLLSDQGERGPGCTDEDVARGANVSERTVARVRQRFVEGGLDAAVDRKKQVAPSRRPKLSAEAEARLVSLAGGLPPAGRRHWTLRLLASQLIALNLVDSISHETVRQTLRRRARTAAV
jgi:transposase